MSYSSGKHDIKFGAELTHQTLAFYNGGNSPGVYTFQGTYSNNAFAEFLLGYPNNVTRAQYQNLFGLTGNFWSFFVQDNVHLTRNLTVNLGLRWELNPFFDGIRGQKTGFDLTSGKLGAPVECRPYRAVVRRPAVRRLPRSHTLYQRHRAAEFNSIPLESRHRTAARHRLAPARQRQHCGTRRLRAVLCLPGRQHAE